MQQPGGVKVRGIDVRGAETREAFLRIHIDIRQHEYKPT